MKIENLLRFNGVRNELFYKPDICSTLGIYPRNVWGFRPTTYSSTMTQSSRQSKISHHWGLGTRSNWQQNQTEEPPSKRLRRTSSISGSGTDGAMMNGGKGETEDSFRPEERPVIDRREPDREEQEKELQLEDGIKEEKVIEEREDQVQEKVETRRQHGKS